MSTERDVLAQVSAVVDAAPVEVLRCTVAPVPGLMCGDLAGYSMTCLDCGDLTFMCTMHLLAHGLYQLHSGTYFVAVVGR